MYHSNISNTFSLWSDDLRYLPNKHDYTDQYDNSKDPSNNWPPLCSARRLFSFYKDKTIISDVKSIIMADTQLSCKSHFSSFHLLQTNFSFFLLSIKAPLIHKSLSYFLGPVLHEDARLSCPIDNLFFCKYCL